MGIWVPLVPMPHRDPPAPHGAWPWVNQKPKPSRTTRSGYGRLGIALAACALCGCVQPGQGGSNGGWNWLGSDDARRTEEWTIECNAYEGPNRREISERMGALLRRLGELDARQVFVQHGERASRVYYGAYALKYAEARVEDDNRVQGDVLPQFTDQINRDLSFIRSLSLDGQYPFFSARRIPRPIPDEGPPEWNLRNAKGVYTLHVGVTYSTPGLQNYKQAAVEWVRDLRNRGYEAYYYHDPDKPQSDICVGTFGESAVTVHQIAKSRDEVEVKTEYSPEVTALQSKEELCWNLENGVKVFRSARDPRTGAVARMPNKSFLVRIPQRDSAPGQ